MVCVYFLKSETERGVRDLTFSTGTLVSLEGARV